MSRPPDRVNAPDKEWAARMWIGADLIAWLRLMARGRFAFDVRHAHVGLLATATGAGHFFLRYAQHHIYGERMRATPFPEDPVFILGHWRCGTTLLHEYLILDPKFAYPSTAECFAPCIPLLTLNYVRKYLTWMLPTTRPMDKMAMGWDHPQEDEFAMCLLGAPSPYLRIAFPNNSPVDEAAYDLDGLPPRDRQRWEKLFVGWLRLLNFRHRKPLVLKSPPHTCRIPTLLKLFPKARFVHLVRDPYTVFSSTVNLWKKLYDGQGVHTPHYRGLDEYVFGHFLHFHRRYEATKGLIPAGQLTEMRYEDLVADPLGEVVRMYRDLSLGDFENVRPRLEEYVTANANYERNKWTLSPELRDTITARWGDVIRQQGYSSAGGN